MDSKIENIRFRDSLKIRCKKYRLMISILITYFFVNCTLLSIWEEFIVDIGLKNLGCPFHRGQVSPRGIIICPHYTDVRFKISALNVFDL